MSMPARAIRPTAPASLRAPLQETAPQRAPRLQIVRAPESSRSWIPFLLLCTGILVASLVGALLLNTAMAVSSYRIHEKELYLTQLDENQSAMQATLETLGSPASLRASAQSIGMVPSEGTVYLSVATRTIIGREGG